MSIDKLKKLPVPCMKCSALASADSDRDYPMCEAHLTRCHKCGKVVTDDSWPPICQRCREEEDSQ